jgi:hypothetical protein
MAQRASAGRVERSGCNRAPQEIASFLVVDEIVAGEVLDDGVKLDLEPLAEHLQGPVLRPR